MYILGDEDVFLMEKRLFRKVFFERWRFLEMQLKNVYVGKCIFWEMEMHLLENVFFRRWTCIF